MLRSTFYSFTTALRGLNTAQKQLDVTGQNISNASTTGYTRQRADTYASTAAGYGDKYRSSVNSSLAGQGSVISGISQARDPFLDVRFRSEASKVGEEDANLSCMKDMQLVFDEIESTTGLRANFSNFVTHLNSLASSASSSEFEDIVRTAASSLVNQFTQYSSQLDTIRKEQESELKTVSVTSVNDLLKNIAGLNDSIRTQEVAGGNALELKDERNLLLDELSTYVNIDVSYKEKKLTDDLTIYDISINMVGEDGKTTQLVYNDTPALFSATLPGEKDATGATVQEAVVTIDNSDVQAKSILETVNKALESISTINKKISSNVTALNANALSLTQANADRAAALLAGDSAKVAALDATIVTLNATKTSLDASQSKLFTNRANNESTLTDTFADYGIQVVAVDADGDVDDVTDYSITLKDSLGNVIKETDGTTMSLIVGATTQKEMTKASLLQTGDVTFENTIANEAKSAGSLKGILDMLNSKGTFDYDNNEIRGIAYYQNKLDSLANQFASDLNKINNVTGTLSAVDSAGTEIEENLFETSDGTSTITASNIKIASGWRAKQYGITKTKKVTTDGATGANENVNLMITQFSTKSNYNTAKIVKQDSYGNYLKPDGTIFANGIDSDGNYTLKIADSTFKEYNPDGSLKTTTLTITGTGTTLDPYKDGTRILTKDADNNYVIKVADKNCIDYDANGDALDATIVTITGTGTTLDPYTDGTNTFTQDAKGDYYNTLTSVKTANKDGIAYKADGTLDATSNLAFRSETLLYNGTYQEFLSSTGTILDLDISTTSSNLTNHATILEDIQDSKDSISSVSIDEEGINLMQYQKAYNAAARLMTTLDEAIDSIINMGTVGR